MEMKTIVVDLAHRFPHPIPEVSAAEAAELPGSYRPLDKSSYDDWSGCEREDYIPTARQAWIVRAVRVALQEGLFYTSDVLKRVIELMHIPEDICARRREKVEGGEVGMDSYYARRYVECQATHQAERAAAAKMSLQVNTKLGTLRFSDGKRCTSMSVVDLHDDGKSFRIAGKRGKLSVAYDISALAIMRSIDRAFEAGQRKDNNAMLWG